MTDQLRRRALMELRGQFCGCAGEAEHDWRRDDLLDVQKDCRGISAWEESLAEELTLGCIEERELDVSASSRMELTHSLIRQPSSINRSVLSQLRRHAAEGLYFPLT